ncbi:MAG: CdaR family protein [Thermodesulfovibrionales bacterium]
MKHPVFKNIGLKITAVLLSILLWIFATSRGLSEISLDVPLEFKNIPPGLELMNYDVRSVRLNIKGQERLIRTISPTDIRVWIDLTKAKKGEGIYAINKSNIRLPLTVTVKNITPSSVKVLLEESVSRTVRVKPLVVGIPEKGYYIKSISVVPQTVDIEGSISKIKKVDKLKTEPLDITGRSETLTKDLKLDLSGMNIRTRVDEVMVKVVIAREKR